MRKLAENIWIFDGETVPFLGMPYSTRMTIVRLPDSLLWVHSPIAMSPAIKDAVAELGEVAYLVAPNQLHHLYLADWITEYPNAALYGTQGVAKKRTDLHFSGMLGTQKMPWSETIHQTLLTGSPIMQECIFFHRSSGTLILTDAIENFSGETFNFWQRKIAGIVGILAPRGKMPLDWRLSFLFGKAKASKAISTIKGWQPKRVVMAHGEIVEENTDAFLDHAFDWLK